MPDRNKNYLEEKCFDVREDRKNIEWQNHSLSKRN
jgi:hypothetical protein